MKRYLSMLLALTLVLLIAAPMLTAHAESAAPGIYFIYADIQAEQTQLNSDYSDWCYYATSWRHQLPTTDAKRGVSSDGIFYLAQNEREGIQLYLTQPGDTASELSVSVSVFTNADSATMPAEVYLEQYVTPKGTTWNGRTLYIADPLVPYRGESFTVQPSNNQALYIETRSATDQAPGAYYATVTISDENGVIATKTIAAVVWDFALPQQHYGSMVVGLYNAASGYESTMTFLKQNGVRTYTYQQGGKTHEEILPEDTAKAEAILEGWDEYLLDHGVNASELPRYLIDTDEKAAELAMADIRRKYYSIPLLNLSPTSSGTYDTDTLSVIRHYQNVIGDNDELTSKAYFYCRDEIDPSDQNTVNALVNAAENAWPEVKRMFTYNGKGGADSDYTQAMATLDPYHNVICINTQLINPYYTSSYSESLANDYLNSYPQRWRYPCEIRTGGFELWIWRLSTVIYRRLPFWQQHNNNEDCMLYWNAAYLANNADVWSAHELPGSNGVSTGNGNGILLYPGAPIGEDPYTPIGSLRLKQIASGLDDEDYLYLADEFLPEADRPLWKEKSDYWWTKCDDMTNNRIALGNKLEAASVAHTFGDWHTVVAPDEAHNGLEVRACTACGTQESREIPMIEPLRYQITVSEDSHNTVTASAALAEPGDTITLTAAPTEPYQFKCWHITGDYTTVSGDIYTRRLTILPGSDITAEAVFADTTQPITFDPETESYRIGDADGSGAIDTLDATVIQRRLIGMGFDDPGIPYRGDADGNGDLSVIDATVILRWLADLPCPSEIVNTLHTPTSSPG